MRFFDKQFFDVSPRKGEPVKGHWILAFEGTKAAIEEVYAYVLTAKENFYGHDYPGFVRDFEESKQFFVRENGRWTPCKRKDCKEKDQVLLRAHSLTPCNIEELEDQNLFFDLWDDMPIPSKLTEAYGIWPLNPKLNGYFRYFWPGCEDFASLSYRDGVYGSDYSVVLDRKTERVPPLFVDLAEFEHDEREGQWVKGDPITEELEELLGIEWK